MSTVSFFFCHTNPSKEIVISREMGALVTRITLTLAKVTKSWSEILWNLDEAFEKL